MTMEELYKKLRNIFGEGCLSEDAHKCEYNGVCILHEKVKALEAIEEYSKQIRAEILKEVECAMHHQSFYVDHELDGLQKWDGGNWIRYKLFENVIEQLKTKDGGKE